MRVLFQSDSCYPLSPNYDKNDSIATDDQMQLIVRCLGPFNDRDKAFISDETSHTYVSRLDEANSKN